MDAKTKTEYRVIKITGDVDHITRKEALLLCKHPAGDIISISRVTRTYRDDGVLLQDDEAILYDSGYEL